MTGNGPRFPPMHNTPRWYLVVTLLWCAALVLLPWATVQVLGDRLPDPIATHWGADGSADGFTPLSAAWSWPIVVGGLTVALFIGLGLATRQLRILASLSIGTATFIGVLGAASIAAQADITAKDARVDSALLWAFVAGIVAGVAGALLVRTISPVVARRRRPGQVSAARPVGDVAWQGPVRMSRAVQIAGWATTAPLVVAGIVVGVAGQWAVMGVLLGTGFLVGLLLLVTMSSTMLVDGSGVRLRSLGRITWLRIPLDEIASAEPTVVSWGEFGGIGLRARIGGDASSGLITSSGEAVRIDRVGQGAFYVTIDPADRIAARISDLVARS